MEIKELLNDWQLAEFTSLFQDQGITVDLLDSLLEDNNLELLIPSPMGKRLKLKKHIKQFLETSQTKETGIESICETMFSTTTDEIIFGADIPSTSTAINSTQLNAVTHPLVVALQLDSDQQSISSFGSEKRSRCEEQISYEVPLKKTKLGRIDEFDLKSLLNATSIGKALIAWYNLKGGFDASRQGYLVELITSDLLNNNIMHLSNSDYEIIATKIITMFPSEAIEAYFLGPIKKRDSRDNKSGIAKGKLVDKFKNKCTFLREVGILPTRGKENYEPEENAGRGNIVHVDSLQWLQHNKIPWSDVLKHWDQTFSLRRQMLLSGKKSLTEVYEDFPILIEKEAVPLIVNDFEKIFPGYSVNLYDKFEEVLFKLIALRKHNVTTATDKILIDMINEDFQENRKNYLHFTLTTLLASLLPCTAKFTVKQGSKQWRPKTVEIREALIVRVELPSDLEIVVESRKAKAEKLGLLLSPFILVVCNGINIEKTFVYCHEILYPTETILKAISTCFMFYHVFHIKYQAEAEHVWYFIQTGIYKIKTRWDKPIPSIVDIVNKVKCE